MKVVDHEVRMASSSSTSLADLFLLDSVISSSSSSSLRDSIHALKSCEHLLPLADDLGIVQSCVDSIAARACSMDPGSLLFSWPAKYDPLPLLWYRIDTGAPHYRRSTSSSSAVAGGRSWLDDLSVLTLPFYKRVVAAMRATDPSSEALERSLVSYARRSIPGLSSSDRKHPSAPFFSEAEQRDLLETVVASLLPEKTVADLSTVSFLFRLLRNVGILRASEASRAALEIRIASCRMINSVPSSAGAPVARRDKVSCCAVGFQATARGPMVGAVSVVARRIKVGDWIVEMSRCC